MNEKKPYRSDKQPRKPNQSEQKPYLEHGNYEKRDNPQADRFSPKYKPKPGDDK